MVKFDEGREQIIYNVSPLSTNHPVVLNQPFSNIVMNCPISKICPPSCHPVRKTRELQPKRYVMPDALYLTDNDNAYLLEVFNRFRYTCLPKFLHFDFPDFLRYRRYQTKEDISNLMQMFSSINMVDILLHDTCYTKDVLIELAKKYLCKNGVEEISKKSIVCFQPDVRFQEFKYIQKDFKELNIIWNHRLSTVKQFALFCEILSIIKRTNSIKFTVHMCVIPSNPYKIVDNIYTSNIQEVREAMALIKSGDLLDNFLFYLLLVDQEYYDLVKKCNVVFIPSNREITCRSAIESVLSGSYPVLLNKCDAHTYIYDSMFIKSKDELVQTIINIPKNSYLIKKESERLAADYDYKRLSTIFNDVMVRTISKCINSFTTKLKHHEKWINEYFDEKNVITLQEIQRRNGWKRLKYFSGIHLKLRSMGINSYLSNKQTYYSRLAYDVIQSKSDLYEKSIEKF